MSIFLTTPEVDVTHSPNKNSPLSKVSNATTTENDENNNNDDAILVPLLFTISSSTIMENVDEFDENDHHHESQYHNTMMESESALVPSIGSSSDDIDHIHGPIDIGGGGCSNSDDYESSHSSSRPQHQRRIIFPRNAETTVGLRRRLTAIPADQTTDDASSSVSKDNNGKPMSILQKDSFSSKGGGAALLHTDATLSASSSLSSLLCNQYSPLDRIDSLRPNDLPPPPIEFPKSTLYTYSQDTYAGRILTRLSDIFIKPHPHQQQQPQPQPQPQSSPQQKPPQTNTNPTTPNIEINIRAGSAFAGFLSLLLTTCASYMLSPMRDAAALAVGVSHIPTLTLASTLLALGSSVPMGWLFEAPNEERPRRVWRGKYGLTRGDTQGTSLALFYRVFALFLGGYAFTFKVFELFGNNDIDGGGGDGVEELSSASDGISTHEVMDNIMTILSKFGKVVYVAFFLVVHLMKLHSISLIWGVAQEAMEYEEQAKIIENKREREREIIMNGYGNLNDGVGDRTGLAMIGGTTYPIGRVVSSGSSSSIDKVTSKKKTKSGIRLKRLAFVGFGGTLGGILGSVFVSLTASTLRLSGLLVVAAILLLLSAELSIELGQIMLRHWNEGKLDEQEINAGQSCSGSRDKETNEDDIVWVGCSSAASSTSNPLHEMSVVTVNINDEKDSCLSGGCGGGGGGMKRTASGNNINSKDWIIDPSLKKTVSMGSMKRVASNNSMGNMGSMKRVASNNSMGNMRRAQSTTAILDMIDSSGEKNRTRSISFSNGKDEIIDTSLKKVNSIQSMKRVASGNSISKTDSGDTTCADPCNDGRKGDRKSMAQHDQIVEQEQDNNSFKQRLLRGITTIIQSRLLMTIFTYNALYATTTVLLSFQRAELVANRSTSTSNNDVVSDAAFLAKINIASGMAVFALQASGTGAFIANSCGQRGTLSIMPIVRLLTVGLLALWHVKAGGAPPNLTLFLILDEFTKVVNFSVAKPVRESLWSDLSNEARYEAKPIVDTQANRWGGGSAAFLMALLDQTMLYTGLGEVEVDGRKNLFGFPPLLFLLSIATVWWMFVSIDLGNIRRRIDLELKKQE